MSNERAANERVLMHCGCVTLARDSHGRPVCPIHIGLDPGATLVNTSPPNLDGRQAKCSYCDTLRPSGFNLPFFRWDQTGPEDEWYCGCRGWE